MIKSKKGMISIIDSLVFLAIMAIVASSIFTYTSIVDNEEPMAKSVCDELFSIELQAGDLYDTNDTIVYPIATLIAANMNTGNDEKIESLIEKLLDGIVPSVYGYSMTISFDDCIIEVKRDATREMTSEYVGHIDVAHTEGLDISMKIY